MTFLYVMGAIIAAGITAIAFFLRTGGIYNPANPLPEPPVASKPPSTAPSAAAKVYDFAKLCLGQHLTLDSSVPEEEGCAEAVSKILAGSGYALPPKGIPNVEGLITWMLSNGFIEQTVPAPGYIITAHNPNAGVATFAHTGICLKFGIASNNSNTGLFQENYTYANWHSYFGNGGSVTRYFEPLGITSS